MNWYMENIFFVWNFLCFSSPPNLERWLFSYEFTLYEWLWTFNWKGCFVFVFCIHVICEYTVGRLLWMEANILSICNLSWGWADSRMCTHAVWHNPNESFNSSFWCFSFLLSKPTGVKEVHSVDDILKPHLYIPQGVGWTVTPAKKHVRVVLCLVMSDSLQPHGLQPARLLCPWGFSRKEYWSGLPFPSPGDLPNPGIKPRSPTLQADSLLTAPPGKSMPGFKPSWVWSHSWHLWSSHLLIGSTLTFAAL